MEAKTRERKKSRLRGRLCKAPAPCSAPAALRSDSSGLSSLDVRLAVELTAHASGGRKDSNLVFSPLSVFTALALLVPGAGGGTLSALLKALGGRSRDHLAGLVRGLAEQALADASPAAGGPRVSFACGVWHDATRALAPAYRAAAQQCYKAATRAVDFRNKPDEAVNLINRWVAEATNNLIVSIVDGPVPSTTDAIVANAVYFKGKWAEPFRKENTKTHKFHRLDGAAAVDAPFMRSFTRQYIACHSGFKVLRLLYEQGTTTSSTGGATPPPRFSMCVFLPDARDGLWGLADRAAAASARSFVRDNLPARRVAVGDFRLPRFNLTFSGDITGAFVRGLGLGGVFTAGEADLSGMVENKRPVALGGVVHKAVVEVNEEGTEAAAVTASYLCRCSASKLREPPVLVDFVADHPFAFFVIEEVSGAIVFMGHVLDPR